MHDVILGHLLHGHQGFSCPSVGSVLSIHVRNFPHQACKRQFAQQKISALLVLPYLPQSHCPWPVPMRFSGALHALMAPGAFAGAWPRRGASFRAPAPAWSGLLICPRHCSFNVRDSDPRGSTRRYDSASLSGPPHYAISSARIGRNPTSQPSRPVMSRPHANCRTPFPPTWRGGYDFRRFRRFRHQKRTPRGWKFSQIAV